VTGLFPACPAAPLTYSAVNFGHPPLVLALPGLLSPLYCRQRFTYVARERIGSPGRHVFFPGQAPHTDTGAPGLSNRPAGVPVELVVGVSTMRRSYGNAT
jgi:hypothetical protein